VVLEDDALAEENWVDSVRLAIKQVEKQDHLNWFIVKLFMYRRTSPPLRQRGISRFLDQTCASAVMYNRNQLIPFAAFIEETWKASDSRTKSPNLIAKDRLIYHYSLASRGRRNTYAFEPVIFQHIGIYSSIYWPPTRSEAQIRAVTSRYFQSEGKPIVFNAYHFVPIKYYFTFVRPER
jgi:hypothetical protein